MDRISMITLALAKKYTKKSISALEQVVRYIGVTTTEITDGSTTNPIMIKGQSVTAVAGDTVFYNGTSYAWDGSAWQEVMNIAEIITAVEALGGKVHDILADIAPEFDSASTYAVDDVVLYEDDLYIFTNAHTGAWDSSDVTVTSIAQLVDDLRAEIASTNGRVSALEAHVTQSGDVIDSDNHSLHIVGEAIEAEKTATGNPITVTDALPYNAVSLSAEIEAIQDLHGYDHPWVGGAGKNKLPLTLANLKSLNTGGIWSGNSYTLNSVTFDVQTDDGGNVTGIKGNGIANATTTFVITPFMDLSTFNGMVINGNTTANDVAIIRTEMEASPWTGYSQSGGTDTTIGTYAAETNGRTFIRVFSGKTLTNQMFYPMVRVSTESATFAPYSNICPISGRTSVTITDYDSESNTATVTIQLGQTVYGGTFNVTTGVLTVTKKYVDFSSLSGWAYDTANKRWNKYIDDIYNYTSRSANITCEKYASDTTATAGDEGKVFTLNKYILVVTTDSTNAPTGGCVYPLATPTTIQLTPTQLTMLKGYNRLSSDGGGDMSITYRANKADSVQAEVDVLETTKADNADVVDYIENGNTASRAYSANQFILWKGDLYKVTTSIASGATITAGTNVSKTTIGAVLTAILNA